MSPYFRFMTGAQHYRIEAGSHAEALNFVLRELQPTADAEALIRSTLHEECEADFAPRSVLPDSENDSEAQ